MRAAHGKVLLICLIVVLVFVIAASYALCVSMQRDAKINAYKTELANLTQQKAAQVNQFLESKVEELNILGHIKSFAEAIKYPSDSVKLALAQERIDSLSDFIPGITLLDNDGIVIVADIDLPGTDYGSQPYFSMTERGVTFEKYYDPLRKDDYYALVGPFYDLDDSGTMIGTIAIDVPLEMITEILAIDNEIASEDLYLVNSDKVIITNSVFGYTPFAQVTDTEGVSDCFACLEQHTQDVNIIEHEESVKDYIDYRGVEVFGTHAYITPINACLIGEVDKAEITRLAGEVDIFDGVYRLVQENKIPFTAINLTLVVLLIWLTSTQIIISHKMIRYLPVLLVGIALCLYTSYSLLATRQNMGILQVSQLTTALVCAILIDVMGALIISIRLFRTKKGMTRRYVAVMLILAILAFVYQGFGFYFNLKDSSSPIADWGYLVINVAIVFYLWWVIYLLRKVLDRFWTWMLLAFTLMLVAVVIPHHFMDSNVVEVLNIIAIIGSTVSAYVLVLHRLKDIYRKDRALDEV